MADRWLTARPAPALAGLIDRYVGYRLEDRGAGLHRGLPSRHMTFIVSIGQPIDVVAQTDPGQGPAAYRCVVSGLQASHAAIAYDGPQEGVAVELSPLGCRALFGMPARGLWNTSLELDELAGPAAGELWERLQETLAWDERFAVCDEVLCRLLRDDPVEAALSRAWRLLEAAAGVAPVADVARTVGWTRQHFARRFRDEFGLTPKLAARLMRFERARRLLAQPPSGAPLACIAAACGYYDQAHLTRDFVEFAGCPPGRLLAEQNLPSFQDAAADER